MGFLDHEKELILIVILLFPGITQSAHPKGIVPAGSRTVFINHASLLVLDKRAGPTLIIKELEGHHGHIRFFKKLGGGKYGQKFLRINVQFFAHG